MTKCKFNMTKLELECKGHASEEGEDKSICSALTSLVLTLAFNINQAGEMCEEKEIKIEPGYYYIRVKPVEDAKEQIEFLFDAFINGIYMLSEDPKIKKHIKLEVYDGDYAEEDTLCEDIENQG